MTPVSRSRSEFFLTATTHLALGLLATACARNPKAVPTWGGNAPPASDNSGPVYRPIPVPAAVSQVPEPSVGTGTRTTFTQGCTGSFSVRDARTNREISSGRAYNSGTGLIALDRQGRRTRAISSAAQQTVIFLPDCNCRLGGNQSSNLPSTHQFAATAPSAASCAAS